MRHLCFAVICCLILLLSNVPAETEKSVTAANGKCAIPSFKAAFQNSSAVFVGEVLGETKNGDEKPFEFRVLKYWKGAKGKKIKVSVNETARYQAWYQVGEKYLVFARTDDDGRLRDGRCSASKLLSEASKDLKILGRAKTPR
jgi:hypothetical protein